MKLNTVTILALLSFMIFTGLALAHGPKAVPAEPGAGVCVCSTTTDDEGIVSPCDNGALGTVGSWAMGSQPATFEEKLVHIAKFQRLIARLRQETSLGQ